MKKKEALYWFCLFAVFQPDFFKLVPLIDTIYIGAKAVALMIILPRYFFHLYSSKRTPKFTLLVLIYCLSLWFSTFMNGQNLFYAIKKTIECVLITAIVEEGLSRIGPRIVEMIYEFLYVCIAINALLLIPFPNGLDSSMASTDNYKQFFLAIKNGMISWMILAAIVGILSLNNAPSAKKKRRLHWLMILASLTMLFTRSSTGIVVWGIFLLCIRLYVQKHKLGRFHLYNIMPVLFIAYALLVLFGGINIFLDMFRIVFGKSGTVTGRISLWFDSIRYIKLSPFWGYGIREIEVLQTEYGRGFSSHNFILYLTLCGGLIALSTYVLMIIKVSYESYLRKGSFAERVLCIGFCMFFIATLTESAIWVPQWFALLTLTANIGALSPIPKASVGVFIDG